jgi:hypothetical protein
MTTTVLRPLQRFDTRVSEGLPRRRRLGLLLRGLRRRQPTLFQKCLAVHMANARQAGRLR